MGSQRVTPRQAAAVILAFVLGGVAAVVAEQLVKDTGTNPGSETIALATETLQREAGSIAVAAEVVVLPGGYEQRRTPAETALNVVETGRLVIERGGEQTTYLAGTSFVTPAGEPYVLRVVEAARLAVVRVPSP